MNLSKSKFTAGLQCLRRLYWLVHEPHAKSAPDPLSQSILEQGAEVGRLAQEMFPGGVVVEADYRDMQGALACTRELMADPNVPAIFEGACSAERIHVRCDILQRLRNGRWRLIEVKSSTAVKADSHHVEDVAIQKYVLERAGVPLASAHLMHLNRSYLYDGRHLRPDKLFTIASFPAELAAAEKKIPDTLKVQWEALMRKGPPAVEPGGQCRWPYECEFFGRCNKPIPEGHICHLPRLSTAKQEQLAALGVESIRDIPDDFPLSPTQRRACECLRSNKPFFGPGLPNALAELQYPLYFMDFETYYPAIPRYAGMRPYDHIPFQWSVHVQRKSGAKLEHHAFLSEDASDPREKFLAGLLEVLEDARGRGHIVVYNRAFESARLSELAQWFPRQARRIEQVKERLWDLLPVVRRHMYHPAFGGSFSIKSVLPALVPAMSYEGMDVGEGSEAGLVYDALVRGELSASQRRKLRASLLAYCRQDTLAMQRVLEVMEAHGDR